MKPPVPIADLPPVLAKALHDDDGLRSQAIEAFENWLHEHAERPPQVLVTLAFLLHRYALEVMVDEVVPRGEAALALLDEARLDTKATRALRVQIARTVEHARAESSRIEKTKDHPLETMERSALRDLAYKLGESKAPADRLIAARAWVVAAGHESEAREKDDCLGRAALDFADGGDWGQGGPRLEEVLCRPKDFADWLPDLAWHRFLGKAVTEDDVPAFREYWRRALAMERNDYFPVSRPAQASYLAFAVKHQLADIAAHLVDVMEKHCPPRLLKPLAGLLTRARELRA